MAVVGNKGATVLSLLPSMPLPFRGEEAYISPIERSWLCPQMLSSVKMQRQQAENMIKCVDRNELTERQACEQLRGYILCLPQAAEEKTEICEGRMTRSRSHSLL